MEFLIFVLFLLIYSCKIRLNLKYNQDYVDYDIKNFHSLIGCYCVYKALERLYI